MTHRTRTWTRSTRALAGATVVALGLLAAPLAAAQAAEPVADWGALQDAVELGGTQEIVLQADIDAPGGEFLALGPGDQVTLDLNGHRLSIGRSATPPDDHAAIAVPAGAALTIADSAGGAGELDVVGGSRAAAIGGTPATPGVGTITIDGGVVTAQGGFFGAGIGGGSGSDIGTIVITGGSVTATGGANSAGIGGGQSEGAVGSILITGGSVTASGATGGAGLGGGNLGDGVETIITGGSVVARGGSYAAGIGGGGAGRGGTVVISGGSVDARARSGGLATGSGIGAGYNTVGSHEQLAVGTITLVGVARTTPPGTGGTGAGTLPGRGGAVSVTEGPKWFRASSGTGTFTVGFGWTVTLDANGGIPEPDPATVDVAEGDAAPLPELTRAGYAFRDWRVATVEGPVWAPGTAPAADVTLVARWAEEYAITYDLDGGTVASPNPASYHAEQEAITLTAPERDGHVFLGWTGTGLDEPTVDVTIPAGSTGDRDYTATWEEDTPVNLTAPAITGDTGLGDALSASPGTWSLGGLSYEYQWFRGDAAIDDATGATYTITRDDLLEEVSVEVTASRAGDDRYHPATARSSASSIPLGTLDPAPKPTITGLTPGGAQVGVELTAAPGEWGPAGVALGYQWRIDGDDVDGATDATFTPRPEHLDADISVAVTGTLDRFTTTTRVSAAATVVPGVMAMLAPTIVGDAVVGVELTASASTTPSALAFAYQWLRDGDPIDAATDGSYVLTADDEGHDVSVRVTATLAGYHDAIDTSAAVTIAPGDFVLLVEPTVAGTRGVGHELTVDAGSWSPAPDAILVRWLDGDSELAVGTAYTPTVADEGAGLTVKVTASLAGYRDYLVTLIVTVDAEPSGAPAAPDPADLTDDARGGATATRDGQTATLGLPGLDGRWVYVYGYSTPTALGWHRVDGGTVTLGVAALGPGEHRLVAVTVDGSLAGWAPLAAMPTLALSGGGVALGALAAMVVLLLGGLAALGIGRRPRVG